MEASDIFLQELSIDGDCPPTVNLQRKLFKAARKGDLEEVSNVSKLKCDMNCVNSSGKTLLEVAGDLKGVSVRDEMIRALLNGGASLEFALLHAVRDSNAKTVEILLLFHDSAPQASPRPLTPLKCHGHVTPLMLAAWLQDFQLVKLLLSHGFTISDPKKNHSSIDSDWMASEKLGPAVYRLNGYRALASPVYIAACFLQNMQGTLDPVFRACVLNKELGDMAEQEYEFREEYLQLSDGCKEFAVALLNECRSMKEIRCVMEVEDGGEIMLPGKQGKCLKLLEFAIATRNEKFVSHPYSQLVLNSKVYRNIPFLEKSSWKQAVLLLLSSVLFPLLFLVWFVFDNCFPSHKVARMFHAPCVKFLIHCGSYQTFLFLLAFTSIHSQNNDFLEYSIFDWAVLLFVIGLLVDVVEDFYHQGRVRFCSNHWNLLAVASVTSFVLHYLIWWAGRASLTENVDSLKWETHVKDRGYTIILVSHCFFAVGILLAFAENLSFIQANSTTGPLLHAFIQMLIDVAKFFLYFVFVFLAFAVSFTKLYLQYDKARRHFKLNEAGMNKTDPLHLERFGSSMNTIVWSLFGEIDESSFQLDASGYGAIWKTGMVLFGAFNIVAVLVALNILIAILNDSYIRITENLDTEWKFTRTKLWLSWIYKKGVLPPPFNILYVLLPVFWVVTRLFTIFCSEADLFKKLTKRKPRLVRKTVRISEKERNEAIRHLILRYLAKRSHNTETGNESSDSEQENENVNENEAKTSLANNNQSGSQPDKISNKEISL